MQTSDYARAKATTFDEIPVIDVSEIGTKSGFERCARQIVTTAQEIGFFYITGHGVAADLRATAFDAARRFFELPDTDKDQVRVDTNQRGWMAQGLTQLEGAKTHDAKEVFFWGLETPEDDPDYLNRVPLVAPNRWPNVAAPWLFDAIQPYYRGVIDLSRLLLAAIAHGLGQDRTLFETHYAKPLARGQLVYYPPSQNADVAAQRMGAAAHTDFGALTILAQDDIGGLQVRNRDGEWIEAPPIANSFVCNIGDLLELWTGGALVSTPHRVINRSNKARYSIPIFCDPASQTPIDPADFGRPGNGPVTTAGAHIAGRNQKNFAHYAKPDSAPST